MKNLTALIAIAATLAGLIACQSGDAPELTTQSSPVFGQSSGPSIAPGLIGRIFERSGRMRGTTAFAQRNYIIRLSDDELAVLPDELNALADTTVEIFEQMRQDSSASIITREERQAMQGAFGVLNGPALRHEARIIDDYLALDEERRSVYRAAVREWVDM